MHSAWPLSVTRPLSLRPIITPMSDRQAFPFDGAGDFSRAAAMIRYHAHVSSDARAWVPPGGLLSQKGAR